jgi:hypothetical protein
VQKKNRDSRQIHGSEEEGSQRKVPIKVCVFKMSKTCRRHDILQLHFQQELQAQLFPVLGMILAALLRELLLREFLLLRQPMNEKEKG